MTRHRWIPSSLVSSTCSRCGARCTYRGPEVVYGASSKEPVCRVEKRRPTRLIAKWRKYNAKRRRSIAAHISVSATTYAAVAEAAKDRDMSMHAVLEEIVIDRLARMGAP